MGAGGLGWCTEPSSEGHPLRQCPAKRAKEIEKKTDQYEEQISEIARYIKNLVKKYNEKFIVTNECFVQNNNT